MKMSIPLAIVLPLMLLGVSCSSPSSYNPGTPPGGNSGPPPYTNVPAPSDGVASFTVLPLDLSLAIYVTALGHIAGGGHVEPTAHAYIYALNSSIEQNVYAPANGNVILLFNFGGSGLESGWKIMFRCTDNFYYYLAHVVTSSPPAVGTEVHAGDLLGQIPLGGTLDVGAFDGAVTLTGFVNPARYGYDELHCVTPWEYFVPQLKSQIYAMMHRAPAATPDAHIDQDVPGTLAGNWFEQSLPVDAHTDDGPQGWPKTISFALDEYDGQTPRVSLGGWPNPPGNALEFGNAYAVPSSITNWADITVSSGLQEIPLSSEFGNGQLGWLAVQQLSDSEIEVEIWAGSNTTSQPFDSDALFYIR